MTVRLTAIDIRKIDKVSYTTYLTCAAVRAQIFTWK